MTRPPRSALLLALVGALAACSPANLDAIGPRRGADAGTAALPSNLEELQRAFIEWRFGMLLNFGIATYTGLKWEGHQPIAEFAPAALDAGQWADAALAAKMKFGVLTVRHADGFALWNSAASDFDVGAIPWRQGQGDVVREFVDAFRARGLGLGFFYSVYDDTLGMANPPTRDQIDYVKRQLEELLTQYGPIDLLVFSWWSWRFGHKAMPYPELREWVKRLQPDCLFIDYTLLLSAWETDLPYHDEYKGMFVPADNVLPALQAQRINKSGGTDWYWAPDLGDLMSASEIVNNHLAMVEPRWTNFLLGTPPNRDGLLDPTMVDILAAVGALWSPDKSRPPLPAQGPQNELPYAAVTATATSGIAANAIDGLEMIQSYSIWETSGPLPQAITIDLGEVKPDVGILDYVPRYTALMTPQVAGAITSYAIATSVDGITFAPATSGTWLSNGWMKTATFGPVRARYVRLEALAATGASAAATEISIGARR